MATDFHQMNPADILKEEAFPKYKEEMRYFHDQLSGLHHYIYFAQHIVDFPGDLFTNPYSDFFLPLVFSSFLRLSILEIAKLIKESQHGSQTLLQFKNFMKTAVRQEYEDDYRKLLKSVRFTARVNKLIDRAKEIRDKQVAHTDRLLPGQQLDSLTFGEIKEIVREVTKLFDAASFDTDYHYLLIGYDSAVTRPATGDHRPDIERILDSIARESVVLHLPEDRHTRWSRRQEGWPEEKIEQFNKYRRKFGLREV